MANGSYSWLSLSTAISQLSQRLADPSNQFWTTSELQVYIQQSLRQFNSLCWAWRQDFNYNSSSLWNSLGSLTESPRQRTLYDTYAYTEMEYMLMEPPTGQVWSGTSQFSISDLSQALQRRRDEMIQVSNCNQTLLTGLPLTPNLTPPLGRTQLPDSVVDVERVRYLPFITSKTGSAALGTKTISVSSTSGIAVGQFVSGTGINYWSTVTGIGVGSITISIATTGSVSGTILFWRDWMYKNVYTMDADTYKLLNVPF